MLIKGVTKDGDAIPLTPQEALSSAIGIGLSQKRDAEFVYWMGKKEALTTSNFSVVNKKQAGEYDAFAEGTCLVGKTRIANDKFSVAKPCRFKVQYSSSKDEIGAPHITVSSFEVSPLETNPANMVGEVDRTNDIKVETLNGELQPLVSDNSARSGGKRRGNK